MFSWLQSRRVGSAKLHEPVLHPEAGEDWFLALPHDHRARMNREWREELDHRGRLRRVWARGLLRSGWRHALVFVLLNGFCVGDAGLSYTLAACVGFLLGIALQWLGAARLLSGAAGLVVFTLFVWASRGGLSYAHMFWLVPAGSACAYLGIEREE